MPDLSSLLGFGAISLGMVLTPGPNMVYLISRSICQGRAAGLLSSGSIALFLARRPFWAVVQRGLMGTALAALALRIMTEARR